MSTNPVNDATQGALHESRRHSRLQPRPRPPCPSGVRLVFLASEQDDSNSSAHVSIFPCKSMEEAYEKDSYSHPNSSFVIIGDSMEAWRVPGNLHHYMRAGLPPEKRLEPPPHFKDMFLGRTPIPLSWWYDLNDLKEFGWVNYAHEDGTVYSGYYNDKDGASVRKFKVPTEYADCLVECYDQDDVSIASNCSSLSEFELKEMDVIAKRTAWLFQVAGMRKTATDAEINAMLAKPEQRENMRSLFGEGNSLSVLSYPLQFPLFPPPESY